MIRTVLADDHKIFCDGLERVLADSGHFNVVCKAYDGQTLLEALRGVGFDLLIIDIEMPLMNGLDTIKRIRLNHQTCTIVVLSMHEESVFAQEAALVGANAFLNKSMDSSHLIECLLAACSGSVLFPNLATQPRIQSPFSERETQILRLIAAGKTSEEIAGHLRISELTVKTHRRNMMHKLKVNNTAKLVSKALEMGYLLNLPGR